MYSAVALAGVVLMAQVQLPAPKKPDAESLELRYARAHLQLAEANLERVNESNKQMERTVPSSIVAEYQDDVRVAQLRMQQATAGQRAGEFHVWLARAEAERRAADTTWQKAKTVNESAPDTFVPIDVERFRLRAELAKLQLERGQALVSAGREAQLQWQSDLLDNQVQRLKEDTREGMQSIGLYPRWWW